MADNRSLIVGPERLAAWMAWEEIADTFMAENPVTGLCAFDRSRLDQETIDRVLCSHRRTLGD